MMKRTWNFVLGLALVAAACEMDTEEPTSISMSENTESAASPYPPTARVRVDEELRADLAAVRHPSDGGGRVRLVLAEGDDGSVARGARGRWEFEYEAGPLGIARGGALLFLAPPFWGWSTPQTDAPSRIGFTTVESDVPGIRFDAWTADQSLLMIRLVEGELTAGETIRIVYGAGEEKAIADSYAEHESRFFFRVDGDGDGVSGLVADSPAITVHPGPAARITATLPSTAEPGEEVMLTLAVLDRFADAGVRFNGDLTLESVPAGLELPEVVSMTATDTGHARIRVTAAAPGTFRVRATIELENGGDHDTWLSNPLRVEHGLRRLYWGDLHGHSGLSDGTGTPADYFAYARDVAALDLAVLTDHDHFGVRFLDATPALWNQIREEVQRVNRPGEFVALLGYEWTSWLYGHRHVLYFDGEGEIHSSIDPRTSTPQQLWNALAGRDALTFAHHSAGNPIAVDWRFVPDPLMEPVTEIMSVHGSSEAWDSPSRIDGPVRGNFVRDQLERGLQFGFIGSGDSHDGHPGHAHLSPNAGFSEASTDPREAYPAKRMGRGGLAAIRATALEPRALLAALRARDVYATSGPRIWLATALAGRKMGSEIALEELGDRPRLEVAVAGCAEIAYVELVRKDRPTERVEFDDPIDIQFEIEVEGLAVGDFLYVRVLQVDGALAWSSPFYIR